MSDVLELDELPVGTGQRRVTKASAGDGGENVDDRRDDEAELGAAGVPPSPALALVAPEPEGELSLWEPTKMRRPLQVVVGKTVNWRMRKATGIETTAGLMDDEQADAINEPLAEIFNRFEPMRAIAAKQTEIALGIAIYDYVQATVVQAGRDAQALEDAQRRVARAGAGIGDEPIDLPFQPAPPAPPPTGHIEEDEL